MEPYVCLRTIGFALRAESCANTIMCDHWPSLVEIVAASVVVVVVAVVF